MFLNWLRTICSVNLTLAATLHTWNSGNLGWLQTMYHRQGKRWAAWM